ncbi:serine hydrolase [Emticicia sp. C21]|uniref:serine hydrolase domain-containing protein n=1 Tax=Emticicia sp. C21 TaxID=2302915 RepID=UPI000E350872|nr:serine hydrolase domain-containing protein [Emticicia sp. C21]RFS14959.1 class A beta-lactamase-related serine hydrolase [Emticicia sp. C21]
MISINITTNCFNYTKRIFLLFILFSLFISKSLSQPLADSTKKKIDLLFRKWDTSDKPGCVFGIVYNDSLIYKGAYGLANVEENIANTTQSIYYMCSVSKQFAGYSIALLVKQGKLQLDDDIRRYIPWIADFGKKITIQHLLNHTSGLRDDITLANIKGLPMGGVLNQRIALNIIGRQTSLNFSPGEKFSYSNSNYILLAEIVKVVSNLSFNDFVDSQIFKPLGMADSRFIDNESQIIKSRALSYETENNIIKNVHQNVYTLGDGGLFTNIIDMSLWIKNFYLPKIGDSTTIDLFTQKGKLNDGTSINYAMGINVEVFRGQTRFIHNGGLAGYRTIMAVYPKLKLGFLIFGNAGDSEVYTKINQLSELFMADNKEKLKNKESIPKNTTTSLSLDQGILENFVGNYIAENGYRLNLKIKDNQIWLNENNLLIAKSKDTLVLKNNPAVYYVFYSGNNKQAASVNLISPIYGNKPIKLIRYNSPISITDKLLQSYTGNYYSSELDCIYTITIKNHELFFNNSINGEAKIMLLDTEHLTSDYEFMKHLLIKRNKKGEIIGFDINSGAIMNLHFKKM